MQEVAHVASKVEKLLAEVAAAAAAPGGAAAAAAALGARRGLADGGGDGYGGLSSLDGDPDALARLLERVAGEVSRLGFLANKGKVRGRGHGGGGGGARAGGGAGRGADGAAPRAPWQQRVMALRAAGGRRTACPAPLPYVTPACF
jgi:hypothetical protein